MKIVYDKEADVLMLKLRKSEIEESDEIKEGVILDYDKEGRVVSIEILNASKLSREPEKVSYEVIKEQAVS